MRKRISVRGRRRDRNVAMPPTLRYRSTSNSNSRSRKRACSRLRMRPWLEGLLDREECSILRWEDKGLKTFSIAWRHASSHGFDQSQHGDLFYMWAHHTGKLKHNNQGDHSINKSTFRCALHSLKDCIELTQKGDKRGEGAKRTYQFIDPDHYLYDRKRKRACQRRNKAPPKEEVNTSSFEYPQDSTEPMDYLATETNSAVIHVTSPSIPVSELIPQSPDNESSPVNNDIKVPVTFATSPITPTTSEDLCDSFTLDEYTSEQRIPNFLTETQPDGVIAVTIEHVNGNDVLNGVFNYKLEPTTPENQLPNFQALSLPDKYEALDSICNADLSCGGNVRVQKNKQETLSQPEFQIDYSLIQSVSQEPQQQISLENQYQNALQQLMSPSDSDYEYQVDVASDMTVENAVEFSQVAEQSAEDNYFLQNQTQDQYQRVLTEMQPVINDTSFSALEEEPNFDELDQFFSHDIFSVGAC